MYFSSNIIDHLHGKGHVGIINQSRTFLVCYVRLEYSHFCNLPFLTFLPFHYEDYQHPIERERNSNFNNNNLQECGDAEGFDNNETNQRCVLLEVQSTFRRLSEYK
ncbi:unnamed protein product [Mucor hiemalis]